MEKDYLSLARELFAGDNYAFETTGIVIEEADIDYAKCSLKLQSKHKNANDKIMGGALYTLIDIAFAVAANTRSTPTVTLSANIEYLSNVLCEGRIEAIAKCVKSGGRICVFTVDVYHDSGKHIATSTMKGYRC
ncbi:MAG: PaaI family thioesterase [Clostridia bacterium]|nr:PaaI family thioesterase [Clostridia bacterium]